MVRKQKKCYTKQKNEIKQDQSVTFTYTLLKLYTTHYKLFT